MASTNETDVLKLPQFIGTDKPSWLGDFNGAMLKIDTAVGKNIGDISNATTIANAAKATADEASAKVVVTENEIADIKVHQEEQDTMIDAVQSDVENLQNAVVGLNCKVEIYPVYQRGSRGTLSPVVDVYHKIAVMCVNNNIIGVNVIKLQEGKTAQMVLGKRENNTDCLWQIGYVEGNPFNLISSVLSNSSNLMRVQAIGSPGGGYVNTNAYVISSGYMFMYSSDTNTTAIIIPAINQSTTASFIDYGSPGFVGLTVGENLSNTVHTIVAQPYGGI